MFTLLRMEKKQTKAYDGNTYYLWCLIICDYLNSDYLWLLEHMYKSKFGLSVTYLKSMVTDNPKTQKRIMGKNNSEASLSDVDYDYYILVWVGWKIKNMKFVVLDQAYSNIYGNWNSWNPIVTDNTNFILYKFKKITDNPNWSKLW